MLKLKLLAGFMFIASSIPVLADEACVAPELPELPAYGALLSYDQLNEATGLVQTYAMANTAYKTCLDALILDPGSVSREAWRAAMENYNTAGADQNALGKAYDKLNEDWVETHKAKSE
ncbi:MAG: hypothetical protein COA47_12380 [Robiginitomaculum sp.]|nr:MAG: hypothetical protein COA47_12380 [Robiginitomaculum sp.]